MDVKNTRVCHQTKSKESQKHAKIGIFFVLMVIKDKEILLI